MTDLTKFKVDLLASIAGQTDPKGLDIKAHLEDREDYETVHPGRLYPNLDKLVGAGLVEKGTIDKRTNKYTLTADGRAVLQDRVVFLSDALDRPEVTA